MTAKDHLVRVMIKLSDGESGDEEEIARLLDLAPEIESVVKRQGLGELDGNEFGEGYFTWFIYGPDADQLFSGLLPSLLQMPMPPGSRVILRRGDLGTPEQMISLSPTDGTVS